MLIVRLNLNISSWLPALEIAGGSGWMRVGVTIADISMTRQVYPKYLWPSPTTRLHHYQHGRAGELCPFAQWHLWQINKDTLR